MFIKMKHLFIGAMLALAFGPRPAFALSLKEMLFAAGHDLVVNSKITFLKQAETGYGWDLKENSSGSPMALLGIYQYRFINLNTGWHDPFNKDRMGAPGILVGIHLDKLTRTIAPGSSDFVTSIVPAVFRPMWDILIISYGPGYDLDRGRWTHFIAVNLLFGGS